jgi:dUTP pyrophosphatase
MLKFCKVRDVKSPTRGTSESAGIDFYIPNDFDPRELIFGDSILIPSGIKVNVPDGFMLMAANKSGVATKLGLSVGACIVDQDYLGEVHIHLNKVTKGLIALKPGDKIAQFILVPVNYAELKEVTEEEILSKESDRGAGAFGSTNHI